MSQQVKKVICLYIIADFALMFLKLLIFLRLNIVYVSKIRCHMSDIIPFILHYFTAYRLVS